MMWWYGSGMGGWGWALMSLGNVLLWTLIILGVVTLPRHRTRSGSTEPRPTPAELLAERFARGEIRRRHPAASHLARSCSPSLLVQRSTARAAPARAARGQRGLHERIEPCVPRRVHDPIP